MGNTFTIVLPSPKVSGGVKEAIFFGDALNDRNEGSVISMWRSQNPVNIEGIKFLSNFYTSENFQLIKLLIIFYNFHFYLKRSKGQGNFIFTHYSTYILSLILPRNNAYYFIQDIEWNFMGNKILKWSMKKFILFFLQRGNVITANDYLANFFSNEVKVHHQYRIWASDNFRSSKSSSRDVDFVMVLRKGNAKRFDLYKIFLENCLLVEGLKLAIITPEEPLLDELRHIAAEKFLSPSPEIMRNIYARSKFFVMLSEHEGFGLPPLESMGSGCIPICRNSGGVSQYMSGKLIDFMVPLSCSIDDFFKIALRALYMREDERQIYSNEAVEIFSKGFFRNKSNSLVIAALQGVTR